MNRWEKLLDLSVGGEVGEAVGESVGLVIGESVRCCISCWTNSREAQEKQSVLKLVKP